MKKFVFLLVLLLCSNPVFASSKVIVKSLENFSTKYPKTHMSVQVTETNKFKSGFMLEKGSILNGTVIAVEDPKRGKRNAYFVFRPATYTIPSKGNQTMKLKSGRLEAKVVGYKKLNKGKAAKKGAISATGLFVPLLPQIYYFGVGYSNPEKGKTRAASGGRLAYKNSPLVYIEKGDEMAVQRGDLLKMAFYDSEKPKWKIWKKL